MCVPIYETSSAEQVEWIMSDSGAKAIFVETTAHEAIVSGLRDRLSTLEHVWRIEAAGQAAAGRRPGDAAARRPAWTRWPPTAQPSATRR